MKGGNVREGKQGKQRKYGRERKEHRGGKGGNVGEGKDGIVEKGVEETGCEGKEERDSW